MKNTKFKVPQDLICEFAEKVVESELVNRIVDVDDEVLTIEIKYNPDEKSAVYDLMDWVDDNVEQSDE
jgi:hypothetical protein